MHDLACFAAVAAPFTPITLSLRLLRAAASVAISFFFAFSLMTAGMPTALKKRGANSLSTEAAIHFVHSGIISPPSLLKGGHLASTILATAPATALHTSAPHKEALASLQHAHAFSCSVASKFTCVSRRIANREFRDVSKLRKREYGSPTEYMFDTPASLFRCADRTSVVDYLPVTSTFFCEKKHAHKCRASCSAAVLFWNFAAANYCNGWRYTAWVNSSKGVVRISTARKHEKRRFGAYGAVSRCLSYVRYSYLVWKHVRRSAAVISLKSPTEKANLSKRCVSPRVHLPCPPVRKASSFGGLRFFRESGSRASYCGTTLFGISYSPARSPSPRSFSFQTAWPVFTAFLRSSAGYDAWRSATYRPASTVLFGTSEAQTCSNSTISTWKNPLQPSTPRESVVYRRDRHCIRLPRASFNCNSSSVDLVSRSLKRCKGLILTPKPTGHRHTFGTRHRDTNVAHKGVASTRNADRICVAKKASATLAAVGVCENSSNSIRRRVRSGVSGGNCHYRTAKATYVAGWGALHCSACSNNNSNFGDDVVNVPLKRVRCLFRYVATPAFALYSNRRGSTPIIFRSCLRNIQTKTAERLWSRHLFAPACRLSDTMALLSSPSAQKTHTAGPTPISLQLDDDEKRLFDMLTQCARDEKLDIVLRAAGGWVRDKLLYRRSDDIDIAIDKMTGVQFAKALNRWLLARGLPPHTIGVVACNPEQSKHLETATCRLLGRFQVDFVHLRTETYSDGSRIPNSVSFGTPKEDASRRDFTINALFYNLNTREVEDFTGLGLQDVRSGLLRTPLPDAEATLLDDPLRILRAVRFASRFGFQLHPDLTAAAQLAPVRTALLSKVSRERIGIEVKKMLASPSMDTCIRGVKENDGNCVESASADVSEGAKRLPPGHEDTSPGTSVQRSVTRKTIEIEKEQSADSTSERRLHDDATFKDEAGRIDSGRVASCTAAPPEDAARRQRLREGARSARKALFLLVRLRVVTVVFKVPEHVIVSSGSADVKVNPKRVPLEHKNLVPSAHDPQLNKWWVHGLRCAYALTTWMEHYFEDPTEDGAETHDDKVRTPKSAVQVQFRELMEQASLSTAEFTGSHFLALVLGCFLFPMTGRFCVNEKSKPEELLKVVILNSLKLSRRDAAQVLSLVEGAQTFLREVSADTDVRAGADEEMTRGNTPMPNQLHINNDTAIETPERIRLGLLIRSIGPSWTRALLVAAAALQTERGSTHGDEELSKKEHFGETAETRDTVQDSPQGDTVSHSWRARSLKRGRPTSEEDLGFTKDFKDLNEDSNGERIETATLAELATQAARRPITEKTLSLMLQLQQKIKHAGVDEAWKLQPMYDGRAVQSVLPRLTRGPICKEVLEEQVRWQLANPSKTSEDCALHLRKVFTKFTIDSLLTSRGQVFPPAPCCAPSRICSSRRARVLQLGWMKYRQDVGTFSLDGHAAGSAKRDSHEQP